MSNEKAIICHKCGKESLHRSKYTHTSFRCYNKECKALFDESELSLKKDSEVLFGMGGVITAHEIAKRNAYIESFKNNKIKRIF